MAIKKGARKFKKLEHVEKKVKKEQPVKEMRMFGDGDVEDADVEVDPDKFMQKEEKKARPVKDYLPYAIGIGILLIILLFFMLVMGSEHEEVYIQKEYTRQEINLIHEVHEETVPISYQDILDNTRKYKDDKIEVLGYLFRQKEGNDDIAFYSHHIIDDAGNRIAIGEMPYELEEQFPQVGRSHDIYKITGYYKIDYRGENIAVTDIVKSERERRNVTETREEIINVTGYRQELAGYKMTFWSGIKQKMGLIDLKGADEKKEAAQDGRDEEEEDQEGDTPPITGPVSKDRIWDAVVQNDAAVREYSFARDEDQIMYTPEGEAMLRASISVEQDVDVKNNAMKAEISMKTIATKAIEDNPFVKIKEGDIMEQATYAVYVVDDVKYMHSRRELAWGTDTDPRDLIGTPLKKHGGDFIRQEENAMLNGNEVYVFTIGINPAAKDSSVYKTAEDTENLAYVDKDNYRILRIQTQGNIPADGAHLGVTTTIDYTYGTVPTISEPARAGIQLTGDVDKQIII